MQLCSCTPVPRKSQRQVAPWGEICQPFLLNPGSPSTSLRWRALARQLPPAHRLRLAHLRGPLPPESTSPGARPSPPTTAATASCGAPPALRTPPGGHSRPRHPLVGFPPPPPTRCPRGTARPPRAGRADGTAPWGGVGAVPAPRARCLQGVNHAGGGGEATGGGWRGGGRRAATATAAGLAARLPACFLPPWSRACLAPACFLPPWWPRRRCVSLDVRLSAAAACPPSRVVLPLLPGRRRGLADQPRRAT